MDDAVGIVLTALEDLGLDDNTIVVFTSDNGGVASGDAFATSNNPLRGGKGYQYEGGIRVPYFIKVPWINNGGNRIIVPATGIDFYPTLLELAGLESRPEEHNDGISLVPALRGESADSRPLYWHYPHYGNQGGEPSSIIRHGDWKLISYHEDGRTELYNLLNDPQETTDVALDHPGVTETLLLQLIEYLTDTEAMFPVQDPEYNAAQEQQHLEQVKKEFMPQLEKQRLMFLSEDYQPGNNWWGSMIPD